MTVLHILRTKPDEETLDFISKLSEGNHCRTVTLFKDAVDYEELVKLIFASDRVISWW